jgi:Cd(II)/Pb(II)-responsive transcriptional regulator
MGMKIGDLARATGAQVETIRYYERAGLLPPPPRTGGNYRVYGQGHTERLSFILHCRSLSMPLSDIRQLLRIKDAPHESCGTVNRLLDERIAQVHERIQGLSVLKAVLTRLREQCHDAQTAEHCGILKGLS